MRDHEVAAVEAYLAGEDGACERAWMDAHRDALAAGDTAEAARHAFWLALCLMLRGQMAQAHGWLGRGEALVAETATPCAAAGYLLVPQLLGALDGGDADSARDLAQRAIDIATACGDRDLLAFGVLGHGQALLALGDTVAGMARFDEVMVAVAAGEVGPITAGIVYCAVILECMAVFDLPRAAEWTQALSAWCDAQPGLVPYRGQCLVHQAQLLQSSGRWMEALATVAHACARLSDPPHPALGLARYHEAELHRLVGDLERAESAYRDASRSGYDPMPGLALLELDRGDVTAAAASIRRALQERQQPAQRLSLLAAAVEILRAAEDVAGARAAADELAERTSSHPSTVLVAMAAHASGAVLVDGGDAAAGIVRLREAARTWQALHMPYEHARTTVLLAKACAALGDRTAATLELDNARAGFAALGAATDLQRLDVHRPVHAGLSEREHEVLRELAAGRTNREIADALVISPHTVRRHVENIFAKLGVTNRAAATAYAYEHRLVT